VQNLPVGHIIPKGMDDPPGQKYPALEVQGALSTIELEEK
jgi:hypothetical protein